MASKHNRLRKKWQGYANKDAALAEASFFKVFNLVFDDTEFEIRAQPNEFNKIYIGVPLSKKVISEIYTPDNPYHTHGIRPDFAITNTETKKTIYIEVKRQDGWVEGGQRSDGRGNAHERSNKFFTPGLLKILRKAGGHENDVLPFWTVFQGNIARDPCRVREVTCWYDEYEANFFFWRDDSDAESLLSHFEEHIIPLLT
jgi:hypothetical protein